MNPQTMTCDECRDELARRAGWKHITEPTDEWDADTRSMTMYPEHWIRESTHDVAYCHPYPPTLDGADSAVPDGYYWTRSAYSWFGSKIPFGAEVHIPDTGDKVADLYRVALACAVEQDGTHGTDGTDGAKGGG